MRRFYLKSNVIAEPLIWQWYAWSYLIPPITAGCNILERHLKIMESYIQDPSLHEEAVKNPQLLGGPFIDLQNRSVNSIKELISQTYKDCDVFIQLATALKKLDKLLQEEANGDSLEDFYRRVPEILKGYVELVYDLNNHPSVRLIESLIYKKYYNDTGQSVALSCIQDYSRPFVLSTPRLKENKEEVNLKIPFTDKRLDVLFKARYEPCDFDNILDLLEVPNSKVPLFESFFTETTPYVNPTRNFQGEGIRVRYFGHACVLLETKNVSVLLDPVICYETPGQSEGYTYHDLPDTIDYVLLTHNHQDHVLFETLLQLRHKIKTIVIPSNLHGSFADPSLKLILKHLGFDCIRTVVDIEDIGIPDGNISTIPFLGEHSDLNIQTKTAYLINLKGKKFMFAADSNALEVKLYEHIFEDKGPIDTLFIGMECEGAPLSWLYGPLLTTPLKRSLDNSRRLSGSNCEKAWNIVKSSGCKQAYVYAMGQEPWLNYIMTLAYAPESPQIIESDQLINLCRQQDIESKRLYMQKEWIF